MYSEAVQRWWDSMTPEQQAEYRSRTKMFTKWDGHTVRVLRAVLGPERMAVMDDLPGLLRRLADPHRIRDKKLAEHGVTTNGRADTSADTKSRKSVYVPRNKDVLKLAQKLKREGGNDRSENDIALEFTEGNPKRANSLLRSIRRMRERG